MTDFVTIKIWQWLCSTNKLRQIDKSTSSDLTYIKVDGFGTRLIHQLPVISSCQNWTWEGCSCGVGNPVFTRDHQPSVHRKKKVGGPYTSDLHIRDSWGCEISYSFVSYYATSIYSSDSRLFSPMHWKTCRIRKVMDLGYRWPHDQRWGSIHDRQGGNRPMRLWRGPIPDRFHRVRKRKGWEMVIVIFSWILEKSWRRSCMIYLS